MDDGPTGKAAGMSEHDETPGWKIALGVAVFAAVVWLAGLIGGGPIE